MAAVGGNKEIAELIKNFSEKDIGMAAHIVN